MAEERLAIGTQMSKERSDLVEESLVGAVERILSPLGAFVEEMDIHIEEAGGEGWVSPLKVLVADARRRLVELAGVVERDFDGITLGSSREHWDFYVSTAEKCSGKYSDSESVFLCPHCLSNDEFEWDELNDIYRCPKCRRSYSGVEGLVGSFVAILRDRQ